MDAWSPNHWTVREVLQYHFLIHLQITLFLFLSFKKKEKEEEEDKEKDKDTEGILHVGHAEWDGGVETPWGSNPWLKLPSPQTLTFPKGSGEAGLCLP